MVYIIYLKIVMFYLDLVNIIKMEVRIIFKKIWLVNLWEV